MKHTTDEHPDLPGLHGSLLKAEEIANMTEEIHTQLMKIFRRLLQAIQYCPVRTSQLKKKLDNHTLKHSIGIFAQLSTSPSWVLGHYRTGSSDIKADSASYALFIF